MQKSAFLVLLPLVTLVADIASAGVTPIAVSPARSGGIARVEARCPTFSWSADLGARGHELVVYRLGRGDEPKELVLRQEFEGAVSAWTPSLERCLQRGIRYAWSIRAIGLEGESTWSDPAVFEVLGSSMTSGPSETLGVARDESRTATKAESTGSSAAAAPATEPADADQTVSDRVGPSGGVELSVDGGIAAASFTGDGSALTNLGWTSLTGVPAGFADGIDNDTLAALPCSATEVAQRSGPGGTWECVENVPGSTETAGAATSDVNVQPSLVVNFIMANHGEFPSMDGGPFACSPCLGEIRMFAGPFTPAGWLPCDGRLLPISQNQVLFSLIGTTYGGNGETTFGIPDLRGRAALGSGQGPGLKNRSRGDKPGGEESLAAHAHAITKP